jgi:hypothetical protein
LTCGGIPVSMLVKLGLNPHIFSATCSVFQVVWFCFDSALIFFQHLALAFLASLSHSKNFNFIQL